MLFEAACAAVVRPKMNTKPGFKNVLTGYGISSAKGAILGVLWTFPLAAICGAVYRFPIPFYGYASGVSALLLSLPAVLFYGILGGFLVQAIMGGLSGITAEYISNQDQKISKRMKIYSLLAASPGVIFLSILDKIVGPW